MNFFGSFLWKHPWVDFCNSIEILSPTNASEVIRMHFTYHVVIVLFTAKILHRRLIICLFRCENHVGVENDHNFQWPLNSHYFKPQAIGGTELDVVWFPINCGRLLIWGLPTTFSWFHRKRMMQKRSMQWSVLFLIQCALYVANSTQISFILT